MAGGSNHFSLNANYPRVHLVMLFSSLAVSIIRPSSVTWFYMASWSVPSSPYPLLNTMSTCYCLWRYIICLTLSFSFASALLVASSASQIFLGARSY